MQIIDTGKLNYDQLKALVAHRQADIVLSQALCELLHGAGFSSQFAAMEQLRAQNVDNCAAKLRSLGFNELYLEQGIAHNFAEAFAHYWPELDAKLTERLSYVSRKEQAA